MGNGYDGDFTRPGDEPRVRAVSSIGRCFLCLLYLFSFVFFFLLQFHLDRSECVGREIYVLNLFASSVMSSSCFPLCRLTLFIMKLTLLLYGCWHVLRSLLFVTGFFWDSILGCRASFFILLRHAQLPGVSKVSFYFIFTLVPQSLLYCSCKWHHLRFPS